MIKVENVCKSFLGKTVLKNVSFEVNEGEYLAITGVSGSGKTTLLNLIGMLDSPDSGTVTVCGYSNLQFTSRKARQLRRSSISYLFQNYGLIDSETVNSNLLLSLKYKKLSTREKQALIALSLQEVGLPNCEQRKIYSLSGGEQQRIALAKIIVKNPSIILADEPTGSLDAGNRDVVLETLGRFNRSGKTIILVTHDPVVKLCAKRNIEL